MILVTGATGTIGSELVRQLVARGTPVRAMTREPGRMQPTPDVIITQGDFEDPMSLRRATEDVREVFLLSAPGPRVPEHDRAMMDAAVEAGVRKIVKLSAIGSTEQGMPGNWHAAGEQAVRESGLAWTILRPAGFASNALRWVPAIRAGQAIPNLTGSGVHAFVDPRDVAAVAAEALLSADHDGQIYTLTGPELLSVPDQVRQLSEVLGREFAVSDVPREVAAERMRAAGMDEAVVSVAIRGAELIRSGADKTFTADVERVLGRPAGTFRGWAESNGAAFG
ncbi:NAD-dependent epimerase/dehydratase family protein [Kribbella capetownensis]|uniref:NAD-dependent epimerase/dehydratase family protein n=1 Tax=Kribbella capetownensis TaxID=1572659 RepID=A0A4R0JJY0_9ACTN|nr:NAD(P)H-binding protein [Kribbella capetownensis]TCC46617.1 NAD-dependent epimerase/dehydratase family protein [Kribbella capetownensis]